jgi:hypothetical protein
VTITDELDERAARDLRFTTNEPGPLRDYRDAMARYLACEVIEKILHSRRLGPFHPMIWTTGMRVMLQGYGPAGRA